MIDVNEAIKIATTETLTPAHVVEPEAVKKPRGNPAWRKKDIEGAVPQPIKRAEVVQENVISDLWEVQGKDPKMHYCWARKSNDEEINRMIQYGYVPAKGKERIMRNPLESNQDGEGSTKERGDRILMVCSKDKVSERRRERSARHVNAKQAGEADARSMRQKGVIIESVSSSETKRESLAE